MIDPEQIKALWARLTARYPQAFPLNAAEIRPLKVGTHRDLLAAHPELDPLLLRHVLGRWCGRPSYQKALIRGGARVDLAGEPAGEVSPEQAEHARERLKVLTERAKRQKAQPGKPAAPRSAPAPGMDTAPAAPVAPRVPARPVLSLKRKVASP